MTSRIKGTSSSAVEAGTGRVITRVQSVPSMDGAGTQEPAGAAGDSVSLTDTALRLAALQDKVATLPDIDAGRVAELRQAIEQGQYRADPVAIADRLLQLERDLGVAGRSGNGK